MSFVHFVETHGKTTGLFEKFRLQQSGLLHSSTILIVPRPQASIMIAFNWY
jgi:hypothetical protein